MANLNNGAYSTLASGITSGATSLSVASGEGARFPSSNFYISVYDSRYPNWAVAYRAGAGEIMLVATKTTDAFSGITRAQGGTSAVAFNTTGVTYRVENNLVSENLTALSSEYVDLTTAQNINGVKSFQDGVKVGEASTLTGSIIFFTEANANTGSFIADANGYTGTRTWTAPDASGTVMLTSTPVPQQISASLTSLISGATTRFGHLFCSGQTNDWLSLDYIPTIITTACTIDKLYVKNYDKTGAGDSKVVLYKNGSATTLTASIVDNSTTSDLTHSVSFAVGDTASWYVEIPGTDTITNITISARLIPTIS